MNTTLNFTNNTFYEIQSILASKIEKLDANQTIEFQTNNNDLKAWVDLATILQCKMLIPKQLQDNSLLITFEKLNTNESFHKDTDIEQKYGKNSTFATIEKLEQPAFLYYYEQALKNVKVDKRIRILNLGINSGDEFEVIKNIAQDFNSHELIGIDYCESAIESAKERFCENKNISLYSADINELKKLDLGKFDLIISIGTLQSTSLELKPLFMNIVQNYLKKDGSMILGFPNCRWIDGEMIYGAQPPNYNFSEMSILYNDVIFCKKYLQQKKYRVTITGKEYIFLTATSIRKVRTVNKK
jgi:2-polyprenyl-3-methyl-5-hydroxy-6-metoxy-1,4-benzoquinol methylase